MEDHREYNQEEDEEYSPSIDVGGQLMRGGLIWTLLVSIMILINTVTDFPISNGWITDLIANIDIFWLSLFVAFASIFFYFLAPLVILSLGPIMFYGGLLIKIKRANLSEKVSRENLKQFMQYKKVFVIISLIVSNWTFNFVPFLLLIPGSSPYFSPSVALPLDRDPFPSSFTFSTNPLRAIQQGFLENPLHGNPGSWNITRLISIFSLCILITTVVMLSYTIFSIAKDWWSGMEEKSNLHMTLEFGFNGILFTLLVYQILVPIIAFLDLWPFNMIKLYTITDFEFLTSSELLRNILLWTIDLFVTPPLTMFFLIFLLTDNFKGSSLITKNRLQLRTRLIVALVFAIGIVVITTILFLNWLY